jgi:hypothetical protein
MSARRNTSGAFNLLQSLALNPRSISTEYRKHQHLLALHNPDLVTISTEHCTHQHLLALHNPDLVTISTEHCTHQHLLALHNRDLVNANIANEETSSHHARPLCCDRTVSLVSACISQRTSSARITNTSNDEIPGSIPDRSM